MRQKLRMLPAGNMLILLVALVLALTTNASAFASQGPAVAPNHFPAGSYHNPVIPQNAADPSIIHALDGYYYLYATTTNFGTNPTEHIFPIWRSTDLAHWKYVGDAFHQVPDWV